MSLPPTCPVAHPFGQLQLELEGVPPLTQRELIERLDLERPFDEPENPEVELRRLDSTTRASRARRLATVRAAEDRYQTGLGTFFVGGEEVPWLYAEGLRTFVNGEHLASMLCLHSACERTVAAALKFAVEDASPGLTQLGLGKLAKQAKRFNVVSEEMYRRLVSLTQKRNATAHFRPPMDKFSVGYRTYAAPDASADLDETLESDAEQAVHTATDLLLGGIGIAGTVGQPRAPLWTSGDSPDPAPRGTASDPEG